jgi:hypothetical protein
MIRIAVPVALLAAAVTALAANGSTGGGRSVVLVAHGTATKMRVANAGRPGLGDGFVERGTLTTAARKPAGTFGGEGTLLSTAGAGSELQTTAFALRDGTLTAVGTHPSAERFSLPIVSGTGAYAGARGTAAFASAPHDAVRVTITLLP